MTDLQGKVAVVVGASAEGGTGWATAALLADHGAKVVVAARRLAPLQALAEQIKGVAAICDVEKEQDIISLCRLTRDTYGRVDIAINAAGGSTPCKIADATYDVLLGLTSSHYFSNVFFIKHMAEAIGTDGAIVLFSSVSVFMTLDPHGLYASAKAASDCLVRYAAVEYGPRRIRVNSIQPGCIVSDMTREYFAIPGVHQAHLKETPIRRLTYPEDYAEAALWLATSPAMTGSSLVVAAGNHLTRLPSKTELILATRGPGAAREVRASSSVNEEGAGQSMGTTVAAGSVSVGDVYATGDVCPCDGSWQVVDRPDVHIPCAKGFPMPRYGGRAVHWRLARLD